MNQATRPSILLVDDKEDVLRSLHRQLASKLGDVDVDLKEWVPRLEDGELDDAFAVRVDAETALVVTDYDLTTSVKGLFGLSIVAWSQNRSIPVGDFSRGKRDSLPKEPNLFELRVPPNDEEGAEFISSVFRGFQAFKSTLEAAPQLVAEKRSLAAVLAAILGRPHLESSFALYMSRLGAANSALLQKLREFAGEAAPEDAEKKRLLVYVLGHVLFNAILKYPGPILSEKAIAAYIATGVKELEALDGVFAKARYSGPFSGGRRFYWREDVDSVLDELGANVADGDFASFADYNRHVVGAALSRELTVHQCVRCEGKKGGFWCPFTQRAVCERADCSVPASSWIPQGAQLCRVERDFYDEWAPLLGL
jgi:hypothetical protein